MSCLFLLEKITKKNIPVYFKSLMAVSFAGIFIVYLLSYFNSENHAAYFNILKNKIPFLFIPLSLLSVEKLDKKYVKIYKYIFISCALTSSVWSYFQYQKDVEYYANLYTQGEVMPTLIHHVSFAVLLCIAVLFVINNIVITTSKYEKAINFFLLIWFVYFIHILSVRTGVVLLYIGIFLFALIYFFVNKKPVTAGSIAILLVLSAYFSYQKIPTLKNKIGYTLYGIQQLKNNTDSTNQISDARRILSDKIGIEILKKNKLFGVGIGDIQDEMNIIYKQCYPAFEPEVYAHIHNQYLYTTVSVGIILGIVFFVSLLLPLIYFIREKNALFSIIYLMLLLLMNWEPFIENQLGTSIFLLVCCLGFGSKKDA